LSTDDFDGWDDADWGWKDEEEDEEKGAAEAGASKEVALSWLQSCHISVSPTTDFMAIARESKMVLLACRFHYVYI